VAPQKATQADVDEINRLIDIAQMRGKAVGLQDREDAILQLLEKFQYLIRKIAKKVYRSNSGYEWKDWEHDATTVFLELLVDDYIPKEHGGASGFAHYITQKLYFRLLHRSQQEVKHYTRTQSHDLGAYDGVGEDESDGNHFLPAYQDELPTAVKEAILANTTDIEEGVMDNMRDEEMRSLFNEIVAIANKVLDKRERFVFFKYFYSHEYAKDIGPQMEPKVSKSRINQIVKTAREKIHKEIGRRYIGRKLV